MEPTEANFPDTETGLKNDGTQSIRRTLEVIRIVTANQEKGITLSSVAKKSKCHVVTAHRILSALVKENFLTKISKKYFLGIELFVIGSMGTRYNIASYLQGVLDNIAEKTGNSTYLLQRVGLNCVCIGLAESDSHIRIISHNIGTQTPLGVGSGSLALLSCLDENEIDKIIIANEKRYKNFNLTVDDVRKSVRQTRKLGIALSENFYKRGVAGVAIPIYSGNKNLVAAISVAALASEMTKYRRIKVAEIIRNEIEQIDEAFSYWLARA
jgi:DNA-binding IclR family transcriptional regulator